MRITNQIMTTTLGNTLNTLRGKITRLQSEIGTGSRIIDQSDDPAGALDSMRLASQLEVLDQWDSNITDTKGWLQSAESALNSIISAMNRGRDLAIQGADGSLPIQSKQAIATEVDTIMSTIVSIANEKHGRYSLFGGHHTDTVPFDFNAGVFTYHGDAGVMRREIGPGVYIDANLPGTALKLDDVLGALHNLAQDLNAGLEPDRLTEIDQALDVLISLRSELGSRGRRIEQAEHRSVDMRVNFEDIKGRVEGVEYERAILDMSQLEMAYRVALQVGGRILPPSLMDFLR